MNDHSGESIVNSEKASLDSNLVNLSNSQDSSESVDSVSLINSRSMFQAYTFLCQTD